MAVPGFTTRCGAKKNATVYTATWPSAASAAVTALLPLLSEDLANELGQVAVVTVDNRVFQGAPLVADRNTAGNLVLDLRFDGLELIWLLGLGFQARRIAGTSMPENLGGGAYRHLFEVDPVLGYQPWLPGEGWVSNDGLLSGQGKVRRATVVVEKGANLWETKDAVVEGLTFQGNAAGMSIVLNMFGYTTNYFSTVNPTLSALSCPTEPLTYMDMEVSITDGSSAVSLTELVGFQWSIRNNLSTAATTSTAPFVDEPRRAGPAVVQGTFALPSYSAEALILQGWAQTNTALSMRAEFTGDTIGGGNDFRLTFYFPALTLSSADLPVQGPQQVQGNFAFVAHKPSTVPFGFPASVKGGHVMVEVVSTLSTNPLI